MLASVIDPDTDFDNSGGVEQYITNYIAGYVCYKFKKVLNCSGCVSAMGDTCTNWADTSTYVV